MQKILNPSYLFIPLISIKNKKMKSFTYSATLPLNETRNLPPSHVTTLPPFPPSQRHLAPTLPIFPTSLPSHLSLFPTSLPSNLSQVSNLTILQPFPPSQPHHLPHTIKALQNNIVRSCLSPHCFLRGGSQYQNWKANSYFPIHGKWSWTARFKL